MLGRRKQARSEFATGSLTRSSHYNTVICYIETTVLL